MDVGLSATERWKDNSKENAPMSKVMFLVAMWRLGPLCVLCGKWCEQQPALA